MPSRFTETDKWSKDVWFTELNKHEKLLWVYLCENCDVAGIWEISKRVACFQTGLSAEDFDTSLAGLARGYIINEDETVLVIKNFLVHQKNFPLNPENNCHKGIILRLERYKCLYKQLLRHLNGRGKVGANRAPAKPLARGLGKGKGKGKGNIEGLFDIFWEAYPRKVGKPASMVVWKRLHPDEELLSKMLSALEWQKKEWARGDKKYIVHPERWLAKGRWEDEPTIDNKPAPRPIVKCACGTPITMRNANGVPEKQCYECRNK